MEKIQLQIVNLRQQLLADASVDDARDYWK